MLNIWHLYKLWNGSLIDLIWSNTTNGIEILMCYADSDSFKAVGLKLLSDLPCCFWVSAKNKFKSYTKYNKCAYINQPFRRNIFSIPCMGDSNIKHNINAPMNVRKTCDKVSPSYKQGKQKSVSSSSVTHRLVSYQIDSAHIFWSSYRTGLV